MSFIWGGRKAKPVETNSFSAPAAQPGSPLELVRYSTETGKFEIPPQALKVLRNVRGPIGVVSVCGRARQARLSIHCFLLNAG